MADPKIRYDILANAEGEQDVAKLTRELEKLDDAIDPSAAQRAAELSAEIRKLGQQSTSLNEFERALVDVNEASRNLDTSSAALEKLKRGLEDVEKPTRAQAGQLAKLTDATTNARVALTQKTEALNAARGKAEALSVETSDLAGAEQRLATASEAARKQVAQLGQQGQAVEQFKALATATDLTRRGLEQADTAVDEFSRSLSTSTAPTREQAHQLALLSDAARNAKLAYQTQTRAQEEAGAALRATGVDTNKLLATQQRIPPTLAATATATRQVAGGYQQLGTAATVSATAQQRANVGVKESLVGISAQLGKLQSIVGLALGGTIFASMAREVSQTADAYKNLEARIRLVTGEGEAFDRAFQGVFEIAQRTNSSVEETGNLFTKLAQAGKDLGLSQQAALQLTETINQSIQLSGGSADSAKAAIVQLVQGLQSGVLRGDEFNSVMEQSPRLARALADGLSVTTGELRKMSQQGALTTDTIIKALGDQREAVQREFGQLPLTIGRAIENLSTAWTRYIGEADKGSGASSAAAKAIALLAGNLDTLGTALETAGKAWIAVKAFDLAKTFLAQAAAISATTRAQQAETTARAIASTAIETNTAATITNTAAKATNAEATAIAAAAQTSSAARIADTAAIGANTAATIANTAARTTGAAAATTAAVTETAAVATRVAGASRLLGVLGLMARAIPGVGLALTALALGGSTVVGAFKSMGTAIGEGAAKLLGYGDAIEKLKKQQQEEADAAERSARGRDAEAAATKKASEAAANLTKESKALVAEFDGVIAKGESVESALDKVAKSLKLDDISGIQTAGIALDRLAQQGKITGAQVRAALSDALKTTDLGVFQVQAAAAFDRTVAGARRLQAAMDAINGEALRRAGTSAEELATGINKAASSAINDIDALQKALKSAGADSKTTGELLAASLNKATDAATTEKALKSLIEKVEDLGKQGAITGTQMADGLEKARKKLDEMKPGINSLTEAYKLFGLTGKAELERVAAASKEAWQLIRNDTTLSLAQKQEAFKKYAADAIAANKGVADYTLKTEAATLKLNTTVTQTGSTFTTSFESASKSVQDTTQYVDELGRSVTKTGETLTKISGIIDESLTNARTAGGKDNKLTGNGGTDFSVLGPGGGASSITGAGQYTPPDNSGDWEFDVDAWRSAGGVNANFDDNAAKRFWVRKSTKVGGANAGPGPFGGISKKKSSAPDATKDIIPDAYAALAAKLGTPPAPPAPPAPAPASPSALPPLWAALVSGQQASGEVKTVNLNFMIGGKTLPLTTNNAGQADALIVALEAAAKAAGGG